jgi:hypothetical protein
MANESSWKSNNSFGKWKQLTEIKVTLGKVITV